MSRTVLRLLMAICLSMPVASGEEEPSPKCLVTLELIDGSTGQPLAGIVRVRNQQGQPVKLSELVNRGQGIEGEGPIHGWWAVPNAVSVRLPDAPLAFEAISGLETELASMSVDLTGKRVASVRIPLARFHAARRAGLLAGNTHLHLKQLGKREADRYLREVPPCDGLEIVFLSYLERTGADLDYTSNKYTRRDLEKLSHDHLRFGHGQEHRHNFGAHGQGYGHILLLDLPYIVQPVSIGPGIMARGVDAPPLQAGIDKARRAGGKVIWAHNLYGFEDIPNWLTGRVHANNIFDGSVQGSYKDTYYRYLNVGLHVPFSTGTDWFIYDFSRVYVMADGAVTPTQWLDRLAAGKSFITNGPLLEFSVDSQGIGSTLSLATEGRVSIRGRAIGRTDFRRIELVRNGAVVHKADSRAEVGHFVAELDMSLSIDGPSWLALRTPPPPVPSDPELQEIVASNELGGQLFAHTSPIYVQIDGRDVFDAKTAQGLIEEMKADIKKIEAEAVFSNAAERKQVLDVYRSGISAIEKRLQR